MPFNLKRTDCFEHLVNDDRLEVAVATAAPEPLKQALSWSFISNSLKKTYQDIKYKTEMLTWMFIQKHFPITRVSYLSHMEEIQNELSHEKRCPKKVSFRWALKVY